MLDWGDLSPPGLRLLSHTLSLSPHYKWWVFAAVGLGSFTGVMTFGTVNVALPTIAGYFETDLPKVQWVVIAQTLTVSAMGCLLTVGVVVSFLKGPAPAGTGRRRRRQVRMQVGD